MRRLSNWNRWKYILKIGVTVTLLGYLAYTVDIAKFKAIIASIDLTPFLISHVILLLSMLPLAARLRVLLTPTTLKFSLWRLIEIQFTSQFYSMLFPSGLGMAVIRWYKITGNKVGRSVFAVITVIERVMLLFTLLVCVGLPFFFLTNDPVARFRAPLFAVIGPLLMISLLFFCLLLVPKFYRGIGSLLKYLTGQWNSNLNQKVMQLYGDLGIYTHHRHLFTKAFAYHLVYQVMLFIRFYLIFYSFRLPLSSLTILWISMLVLLLLSIPLSMGGIGVPEAGFLFILPLYGVSPEKGLLLGGLTTLQMLVNVFIGGIMSFFEKSE